MIVGQPPPSAVYCPSPTVCQCGDTKNCRCGGIPPVAAPLPAQNRIPYPTMQNAPYGYDQQVPSTSQYGMKSLPSQQQPQMPRNYMQQRSCQQQQQQPALPGSGIYPRSPSRAAPQPVTPHTAQWMNSHYMNNGYASSPAPSVTPSVMSMSHMSVQDDRLSVLSMQSTTSDLRPHADAPHLTELRPCSQISTASCAENIDPCQTAAVPPQQIDHKITFQMLIECFHMQERRREIVNETFRIAKGRQKGTIPSPDPVLIVKITEAITQWKLQPNEEIMEKLALSMFYLCKYMKSTEVFKAVEMTNGMLPMLLCRMIMYSNAALLALIHMLEWRSNEGQEVRRMTRNVQVMDLLMQRLLMIEDRKWHACYQYVLDGLRQLSYRQAKPKEYMADWGSMVPQYNGPKGIIAILCTRTFALCDQLAQSSLPKDKEICGDIVYKALALLKVVITINGEGREADKTNVRLAQQFMAQGGMQRICAYLTLCATPTSIVSIGSDLLVLLSNSELAATVDQLHQEAVQFIVMNVMKTLDVLAQPQRKDPQKWERLLAFLSNFIANRPVNKIALINFRGFQALAYAINEFSNMRLPSLSPRERFILDELADNAALCLSGLLAVRNLSNDQLAARDSALNQNLLKGVLNHLCQSEVYVQKRMLRLLCQLFEHLPCFRSEAYLQKVFDDQRRENLIGCLFNIVSSAPAQLAKLTTSPSDSVRRRSLSDVVDRCFILLNLIMQHCEARPRQDLILLIKNNPSSVIELLRTFGQEIDVCSRILHFALQVSSDESIPSLWLQDRQLLDSLANSSDPKIAQPAQSLVSRMSTVSGYDPMAEVFSAMGNGDYMDM